MNALRKENESLRAMLAASEDSKSDGKLKQFAPVDSGESADPDSLQVIHTQLMDNLHKSLAISRRLGEKLCDPKRRLRSISTI